VKVLLINPPVDRPLQSILPEEVESSRGAFPPLGLLYVAAAARAVPGVEVRVIDAQAEGLNAAGCGRAAAEWGADIVGLTVLTFTLLDAIDVAASIKREAPQALVIAGGPHAHLYPKETLALGQDTRVFDAVLRGEGEESFAALVAGWPGTKAAPPPGVWFRDGARGEPDVAPLIDNLDRLAFPARDLTRVDLYRSVLSPVSPITTMMSSRGCPYKCVFCDRPHLGKKFRARSAGNVVDEMEAAAALSCREVVFYDDTFSVDKDRVRAIADEVLHRGLKIAWDIRARVSDLDREDFDLCRRAGLCRVHFGVETGDPDILKALKKGITLDQARAAFAAARAAGLETLAYFMVGLPGETAATVARTAALAAELDPDYVHFSALIPFPGTPLYAEALSYGVIKRDVWAEFAAAPTPDFAPPLWEQNLDAAEIGAALAGLYRGFYRRPRVILRRLRRVRSFSGLMRGARMGARILSLKGNK
jgi:anaerobic magnesium-protoporphyrin IX monomethyl ester cyclase